MTTQHLQVGSIRHEHTDDCTLPTFLAGKRIYAVGATGGGIVPRGDEHLVGRMGGIWAHPYRILHGWQLQLRTADTPQILDNADQCYVYWSHLERVWQREIQIVWREWMAVDEPEAWLTLELRNQTAQPWQGTIGIQLAFDMHLCWLGGQQEATTVVQSTPSSVQAFLRGGDAAIGAAAWSLPEPTKVLISQQTALLEYAVELEPGAQTSITCLLHVEHQNGVAVAAAELEHLLPHAAERLQAQQHTYTQLLETGPQFTCPDAELNQAWQLAQVNLQALVAAYPPALGTYFLAGIPEYPQFFGCDTTYTVPGALAGGWREPVVSALQQLARVAWMQCGRVPHELTTNGRIFNPGNIQETPQFVLAAWETIQWLGDQHLLAEWYPLCYESMHSYVLEYQRWGEQWVIGDGMVERYGMGPYKLDVQCYTISALDALAAMAEQLGRSSEAAAQRQLAAELQAALNAEWWLPAEQVFADSRQLDGRLQLDGHWTVIVPLQLGLTSDERAAQSMQRILEAWVNQWGLIHTRQQDERVWTLPTGLLALALARYKHPEQAVQALHAIAATTKAGLLGAYEELIPAGLCFLQLWSAGLLLEGIVKGLCGLEPQALKHQLTLDPCLPADWSGATIRNLRIGDHLIDLELANTEVQITHRHGEQPLHVRWRNQAFHELSPGATQRLQRSAS